MPETGRPMPATGAAAAPVGSPLNDHDATATLTASNPGHQWSATLLESLIHDVDWQ
jgi:hypothetical protein